MKSNLQKMLAGEGYDCRDSELLELYHKARALILAHNTCDSRDLERRRDILNQLLGKVGKGVWIETPFFCDYGIEIGEKTCINTNCMFLDDDKIIIGKNRLLAPYVQIYTATPPLKASDRIYQDGDSTRYPTSTKPVTIGDNVWIGGNSVIFPGVTKGNNVTIGAGSVVTKDLPVEALAFGNPC